MTSLSEATAMTLSKKRKMIVISASVGLFFFFLAPVVPVQGQTTIPVPADSIVGRQCRQESLGPQQKLILLLRFLPSLGHSVRRLTLRRDLQGLKGRAICCARWNSWSTGRALEWG